MPVSTNEFVKHPAPALTSALLFTLYVASLLMLLVTFRSMYFPIELQVASKLLRPGAAAAQSLGAAVVQPT